MNKIRSFYPRRLERVISGPWSYRQGLGLRALGGPDVFNTYRVDRKGERPY